MFITNIRIPLLPNRVFLFGRMKSDQCTHFLFRFVKWKFEGYCIFLSPVYTIEKTFCKTQGTRGRNRQQCCLKMFVSFLLYFTSPTKQKKLNIFGSLATVLPFIYLYEVSSFFSGKFFYLPLLRELNFLDKKSGQIAGLKTYIPYIREPSHWFCIKYAKNNNKCT